VGGALATVQTLSIGISNASSRLSRVMTASSAA